MTDERRESLLAGVALLAVRAVLLWLVIPAVAVCWLVLRFPLRRRGVTFGQFLGWADLNLIAALQRSLLRPLFRRHLPWTPVRGMRDVTHRVKWTDPW